MNYRLVPATALDQEWLEELRRAVYRDLFVATWGGWDEARHGRHWASCWQRGNIRILELGGERIGMIQLLDQADRLEIAEVQIQPSHQGRGIGTRLLRDTVAQAHDRGATVTLKTGLRNRGAIRLYERLGFRRAARTDTHFHMESPPVD